MRHRWLVAGMGLVMVCTLVASGWAQIPTVEERTRDSGFNPEYCTWWAETENLNLGPIPARKEPAPVGCYRYDFTLPAQPRQASFTLFPGPFLTYSLSVNGKVLVEPLLPGMRGHLRTVDLTRYLRPGRNVLAFWGKKTRRAHGFQLMAQGIVFGQDGSILRLQTEKTWKGGWDLPEGWDKPETDPASFPSPQIYPRTFAPVGPSAIFYPPYYGSIQVEPLGMNHPIYDEKQPINLGITLLNVAGPGKPTPTLAFEVMDEFSRKTIGQGTVALSPKGKLDLAGQLRHQPLPAGTYRFRVILAAGGEEVDRRDYEVACVGEIKQRLVEGTRYEDGMDLKQVWTVDCTAEPEPGQFIAADSRGNEVKTIVAEGPAGKYRRLADTRDFTFFAYRFKVKRLFVPHLVVIEWPDDAARSMLAQVYEGTCMFPEGAGWRVGGVQRCETSVVSIEDQPVISNQMRKSHMVYWPNNEEAAIHIWNARIGAPVGDREPTAASRITVYEITNDLPALRIADAGDHMIGYHTERGPLTMSSTYYAGPMGANFTYALGMMDHPEFYRNWYTTTENMIKRMRFSGQNMYLMGHFMYNGVMYPSKRHAFAQNCYYSGTAQRDYIALILRMFERNGLNLVSNIEYVQTPDVIAAFSATLEEVINEGAPTVHTMRRDASRSVVHTQERWGGAVNYFHPRVQESILKIVEELVELYGQYPAWKGIAFLLSRNFGPMAPCGHGDDPLDYGYEDYTIDLFQKETGIKIPVDAKDPERFQKRYEWLMANAKEKWIDWRCKQYTRLYRKMRDLLVKARPDLKLYLLSGEPMNFTKSASDLYGHLDDLSFMKQTVKAFGFDPDALKKERGMVIGYFYLVPGTAAIAQKHRMYWELLHNQVWNDLFANDGKGGAYIWAGIPHYGCQFPKGKWLFERTYIRQGYLWPTFMTDGFVNVLVRSNPTWMPHTWMDVAESGGRLHELRLFSRAYRSLPNGKYQRLTGNGLDKNIWIERTRAKGAEYAYAANPHWWGAEVTLTFAPGVKVHDLIKDQRVALQGDKWTFRLGPYQVQTFRITGGLSARRTAILGAQTMVPQEVESIIDQKVTEAQRVVNSARAKEAEIRDLPGWKKVEDLEKMIAQVEKLNAAGGFSQANEIATSWSFERPQQQVINEVLEAIPFLVLGPFGDPKFTVGGGKIKRNPEVVPEYKGMETPYIPETGEIDFAQKYRVYPGKEVGWQEAVKTYHLSFYGKCHSEMPLWMVAYAYTEIYSPQGRDATIWVGSDHAIWVWVNDRQVIRHGGHGTPRGGQRASVPNQNRGNCHLQKGWNRVLVKVVQRGEARIFFRIIDRNHKPMDDLRFRVPKAE